jgi:hypothetical protein
VLDSSHAPLQRKMIKEGERCVSEHGRQKRHAQQHQCCSLDTTRIRDSVLWFNLVQLLLILSRTHS